MNKSIIAVAALLGLGAMTPASAAGYVQGGPSEWQGKCQVSTDGYGSYGYITDCPKPVVQMNRVRHVTHKHVKPVAKPQS